MFRNLILLGLILFILMPVVGSANLRRITRNNGFGCAYITEYLQLDELKAEDSTLFLLMLLRDLEKGYITLFSKNESVSVEQIYGELAKVHRPSELTEYWTSLYNVAS